jgi:hypothetical protein
VELRSVWSGHMAVKASREWSSLAICRNSAPCPSPHCGDAARRPLYANQALDVQMQEVASSGVFVAVGRQPRSRPRMQLRFSRRSTPIRLFTERLSGSISYI